MSKAHDSHACTCPSGDGSLRWPCPLHPALLPCPFCGASARGYEIEPHQHSAALLALVPDMPKEHQGSYVIEGECQCESGLIGDNQAEVTARWNARAPQAVAAQPAPETAIKEVVELIADLEREAADVGYGHGSQRLVNEKRAAIESKLRALLHVPNATQAVQVEPVHADDAAVDALAAKMKAKLAKQRAKGYGGWNTPECSQQRLSDMLRYHVTKGDPVDVANFCAFLDWRGEGVAAETQDEPVANLSVHISEFDAGEIRKAASISMIWKSVKELPLGDYRLYTAPQAQPADALEPIRQAVRDYHYALDARQHGGVAAHKAIYAIEEALGMHWKQGLEASLRADKQDGEPNG